jgi:hypothetical protein
VFIVSKYILLAISLKIEKFSYQDTPLFKDSFPFRLFKYRVSWSKDRLREKKAAHLSGSKYLVPESEKCHETVICRKMEHGARWPGRLTDRI